MARGARATQKVRKATKQKNQKVHKTQQRSLVTALNAAKGAFPGATTVSLSTQHTMATATHMTKLNKNKVVRAKQFADIAKRALSTTRAVDTKLSEDQMWESAGADAAFTDALVALKTTIPGFAYAEVFAPDADGNFVGRQHHLAAELAEEYGDAAQDHKNRVEHSSEMSDIAQVFKSGKAKVMTTVGKDQVYHKFAHANGSPFKSGVVVPIKHNGKVRAIIRVYSTAEPMDEATADETVNGITAAAVYANTKHVDSLPFKAVGEIDAQKQKETYLALVNNGVFSPARAFAEVQGFFKMGFAPVYFKRFAPQVIANHIQAFIASKQFADASHTPEEMWLAIENNTKFMGGLEPEQSLHIVPSEARKVFAVERNIIRRMKQVPENKSISLEVSTTAKPFNPNTKKKAAMYVLQTHKYANPAAVGDDSVTDLAQVASENFMKHKTPLILERYQEVVSEAAQSLAPVAKIYPAHKDGSIPVMFAFKARKHDGPHANFMLQATQLLENNKLKASRKFLETFANNVHVMSLYIDPTSAQDAEGVVQKFTKQFSMMSLVPQSEVLTPHFLNGAVSAEQYTYLTAASKLIYYTISSRPDEYNSLSEHLKDDQMNLGRLRSLYSTIRREAVSHSRIQKTFLKYPALAKKLYEDFELRTTTDIAVAGPIADNEELTNDIQRQVQGNMEQQIFQACLSFNKNVPKTNFFRGEKSAISFRLKPQFFEDMDLPRLPFGVFFVVGAEFQGFHVRFADVSRGGIRLIKSADDQVYNKNVATQFNETFNLAFTQNLKNKDIPEFGSKGTVLLNPDCQDNAQGIISFQRFVDSLLDLITEQPAHVKPGHPHHFVNNYGKSELLFLGPDEGTAGVMSWAALYSKKRGYSYWRAFTTGKPPALGGIPHDTYGMTTNSVHRYVVGCIEKLGLKEEECTKIQTGGPDGDLGSNEITISKDKTIAIVDGSGVLYDPEGIDRTELTRLAHARVMGENFDKTKLGPKGFFVGVNDKDVTLPSGDKIESGTKFRNEFHLTKFAVSDLFVPCGGRPASIDLSNVNRCFDPKTGKPKFKVVVEGANLFITPEARQIMEKAGVVLYKDASSNKGGVTSSSLEVLAALALEPETFEKHMACTDPSNPPEGYKRYVKQIQAKIIDNANNEFECIWREHLRTGLPRNVLTDKVSNKINTLNDFIHASSLWDSPALRKVVLKELLPEELQSLAGGYDNLVKVCPESYLKACFSAYLSSRFVYRYGIDSNDFAFFEFMTPYTEKALQAE